MIFASRRPNHPFGRPPTGSAATQPPRIEAKIETMRNVSSLPTRLRRPSAKRSPAPAAKKRVSSGRSVTGSAEGHMRPIIRAWGSHRPKLTRSSTKSIQGTRTPSERDHRWGAASLSERDHQAAARGAAKRVNQVRKKIARPWPSAAGPPRIGRATARVSHGRAIGADLIV
jgi:hypothetical protein